MRCKYNTSVNIQCGKKFEQEKQPEFMGNLFFPAVLTTVQTLL